DLERTVALLVELHRVRDRARLADQRAVLAQQLDDALARLLHGLSSELVPVFVRTVRAEPDRRVPVQASVPADDRPGGEIELTPPPDVGEVTEGADHRNAAPLLGVGEMMSPHRHADAEEWREHFGIEERLVPLVVWMSNERDARRDQLGPCRLDDDVTLAVDTREPQGVVRAGELA